MRKVCHITIIICLLLACCALVSCAPKISFEDITITGDNVYNLPEGTYTLRYSIENLDKFAKKHDYSLVVTVTDKDNKQITVENNRVLQIQADGEYYVTILLQSDGKTKTHNYTVSAIKSDIVVTFSSGNYKNFENIIRTVTYGGTLTDIPEIPEYTPPAMTGHTAAVTKAEWDKKDYTNLTQNITVKAVYEYNYTPNKYTITYHTDGGTEIAPITDFYGSQLLRPDAPTKDGFVLFDWYSDEDLKTRFSFELNSVIKADLNLYALWITPNAATDEAYFTFEHNSGGRYYTVRANDRQNMPETVIIPNTYNGKAVTKIAPNAFARCPQIKHITIPETIDEIGVNAFSARIMQDDPIVTALETVTFLPTQYLVAIPTAAFDGCDKLTQVNIPDSVGNIEMKAFNGCVSLNNVHISPDSRLMQVSDKAFYGCAALESITLPKGVFRISEEAFYNCTALTSVTLNCDAAPALETYAFSFSDGEEIKKLPITFYVQSELLSTYKSLQVYDGYTIESILE